MKELKKIPLVRSLGGKRIVHIASCPYIKEWDVEGCEQIDKIKDKMSFCPTCQKAVFLSEICEDFWEKKQVYDDLFKNIPDSKIRNLWNQKTKILINNQKLFIRTKRDDWFIDLSLKDINEFRLFHGNYNVTARKKDEKDFSSFKEEGFHEHECGGFFSSAINQIIKYDYKMAEKIHKKNRMKNRKQKFSDLYSDSFYEY